MPAIVLISFFSAQLPLPASFCVPFAASFFEGDLDLAQETSASQAAIGFLL